MQRNDVSAALEGLLDKIEFELEDVVYCCLYQFSWSLSDHKDSLTDEQRDAICRAACDEIRRRHPLKLLWVDWPIRVEDARDAAPGTPLDFDLDPEAPVSTPLLALVRLD